MIRLRIIFHAIHNNNNRKAESRAQIFRSIQTNFSVASIVTFFSMRGCTSVARVENDVNTYSPSVVGMLNDQFHLETFAPLAYVERTKIKDHTVR